MEILTANQVNVIVDKLDRAGVEYLQFDAYNEEDYSEKYQSEYIDLFEEIVVNKRDPDGSLSILGIWDQSGRAMQCVCLRQIVGKAPVLSACPLRAYVPLRFSRARACLRKDTLHQPGAAALFP